MASVISSSPRSDGSIARTASWIAREQVDADQGQVRRRIDGLLDQAHDVAVVVDLGHAEAVRVGHRAQQDLGRPVGPQARRSRLEPVDEVPRAPAGACCRRGT